jgi:hypothetical protein
MPRSTKKQLDDVVEVRNRDRWAWYGRDPGYEHELDESWGHRAAHIDGLCDCDELNASGKPRSR